MCRCGVVVSAAADAADAAVGSCSVMEVSSIAGETGQCRSLVGRRTDGTWRTAMTAGVGSGSCGTDTVFHSN